MCYFFIFVRKHNIFTLKFTAHSSRHMLLSLNPALVSSLDRMDLLGTKKTKWYNYEGNRNVFYNCVVFYRHMRNDLCKALLFMSICIQASTKMLFLEFKDKIYSFRFLTVIDLRT